MPKQVTARQFIGRGTVRYRARYLTRFNEINPQHEGLYGHRYRQYDRPEYLMPHADHAFQIGPYLVSRPYRMEGEYMREILDWVDQFKLQVTINAPSSWHPATLVITAYASEFVGQFWENADKHGDAFKATVVSIVYRECHGDLRRVYEPSYYTHWDRRETGVYIQNTRVSKHGVYGSGIAPDDDVERFLVPNSPYHLGEEE